MLTTLCGEPSTLRLLNVIGWAISAVLLGAILQYLPLAATKPTASASQPPTETTQTSVNASSAAPATDSSSLPASPVISFDDVPAPSARPLEHVTKSRPAPPGRLSKRNLMQADIATGVTSAPVSVPLSSARVSEPAKPVSEPALPPAPSVQSDTLFEGLVLACFPVHFFFQFLYYTDVWSTTLILAAYWLVLKQRLVAAALVGLLSLAFRQTNVVWLGAFAAVAVINALKRRSASLRHADAPLASGFKPCAYLSAPAAALLTLCRTARIGTLVAVLRAALSYPGTTLLSLLPFTVPIGAFAAFVYINEGIVMGSAARLINENAYVRAGDKENHVAGLHMVQPLYAAAFVALMGLPVVLRPSVVKRAARDAFGSVPAVLTTLVQIAVCALLAHYFTYAHIY